MGDRSVRVSTLKTKSLVLGQLIKVNLSGANSRMEGAVGGGGGVGGGCTASFRWRCRICAWVGDGNLIYTL